ncbi:hypothetical protein L5515_009922 [Caenorhabditis briggsae]|uniref:PCI domain-containing protein n=2 Tax=Caenorhabditis briggsae TaxID=6238 RepID=A0AAE9FBM0_CAEBR|nr:hypothetical protein L5515_009922 [Caenorhabditis briggsae]
MSNDILDDPMDTGAPSSGPIVGSGESSSSSGTGGAEETIPAVVRFLEHHVVEKIPALLTRAEEKRDKENFDEVYDLTVTEPAVDVETIGCNYDGNSFFLRARFIAKHCTALKADAYIALINYLKENTKDTTHYIAFFNELEQELGSKKEYKVNFQIPVKDTKWVDETSGSWQVALDHLQIEYKRHKDEGVKESTRRAMEDLFRHFLVAGKTEEAIRLYSRGIRDYCTQLKHSINMWMNWIEVSICGNDWGKLESITSTAFRSLKDADDAEKNNQQQQRGENATYLVDQSAPMTSPSNRQLIETALAKCQAAQVILKLRNHRYSDVLETVLVIKTECLDSKWYVTSSDLGIYSVLCAMATLGRTNLKKLVGGSDGNGTIRKLLESEPLFFEMLTCYVASRFGRCFEIMNSVKNRLLLDPFISRNVNELFSKIRQKCVVQYLQPYSTIKMETMCQALGTTISELQTTIVELAEEKNVQLRIDQNAGIIRMMDTTDENATLRKVNDTCDRAINRAQSLVWKAALANGNIHSISDKESRQKRKNQKDRPERSAFDEDMVGVDDFNVFEAQQQEQQRLYDELGDM